MARAEPANLRSWNGKTVFAQPSSQIEAKFALSRTSFR